MNSNWKGAYKLTAILKDTLQWLPTNLCLKEGYNYEPGVGVSGAGQVIIRQQRSGQKAGKPCVLLVTW